MLTAVVLFALLLLPQPASASCDARSSPTYDDIDYIKMSEFSLVGQLHPWFTFEGTIYKRLTKPRVVATLDSRGVTKLRGSFEAVAPNEAFKSVVDVLRRFDFYTLRFNPTTHAYIDGPEDAITVVRCGVSTTLGTIPYGEELELGDAQGKTFFQLEKELHDAIFAADWTQPVQP